MLTSSKEAYQEILDIVEKHKNLVEIDLDNLKDSSKIHLFYLELTEKYGLNINRSNISNLDWNTIIDDNVIIGYYDGKNRRISWSDDGRQPKKEYLVCIRYPTGAYYFDDSYPVSVFSACL